MDTLIAVSKYAGNLFVAASEAARCKNEQQKLEADQKQQDISPPSELTCALSKMLFEEPVTTTHGYIFEKSYILAHLRSKGWTDSHGNEVEGGLRLYCPIGGSSVPLSEDDLAENTPITITIKNLCKRWSEEHPSYTGS